MPAAITASRWPSSVSPERVAADGASRRCDGRRAGCRQHQLRAHRGVLLSISSTCRASPCTRTAHAFRAQAERMACTCRAPGCTRTQRPGEQDQAVEQRTRHEPAFGQRERGVDRVGAEVQVDPVDPGTQELEQSVGRPQGGRERVADPGQPAAGDGVQLGQAERKPGSVRKCDRGPRSPAPFGRGGLAEQPCDRGIAGRAGRRTGRIRISWALTMPSPDVAPAAAARSSPGPRPDTPCGANQRDSGATRANTRA